jgi:hypothetical protein
VVDLQVRSQVKSTMKIGSGEGVGYRVIHARNVQNSQVVVTLIKNVDRSFEQVIIRGQSS